MGVGSPEDLVESVASGVDMFDCVLPTRIARNGAFFSLDGRKNIFNSKFKSSTVQLKRNVIAIRVKRFQLHTSIIFLKQKNY
ncbi:MAG: hypothetical protein CM1200mP38_0800 [Dehalococcoidia bacterium]|nr:MAG: hypothetical protein CM1200mP38_0800 [Dehalococcoidia bacterium]